MERSQRGIAGADRAVAVRLWRELALLPVTGRSRPGFLLREAARTRQAALLALRMKAMRRQCAGLTDFSGACERVLRLPWPVRYRLLHRPELRAALRLIGAGLTDVDGSRHDESKLTEQMVAFARLGLEPKPAPRRIPTSEIELRRDDVHPFIRELTPPTYVFPENPSRTDGPFTLEFFGTVAAAVLRLIEATWPELRLEFEEFVRCIIHVKDVGFRSCSAQRYAGVFFCTSDDSALIELEESFVHEYAHQVLYTLMEIDPLLAGHDDHPYRLPWSGAWRDRYGYLHAYYIYTQLALYFERVVAGRRGPLREFALDRLRSIVTGLLEARPDFLEVSAFTGMGWCLVRDLDHVVLALAERTGATA